MAERELEQRQTTVKDRQRFRTGIYDTPQTYTTIPPAVQTVDQLPKPVQEALAYLPSGADAQDAWNLKVALTDDSTPLRYEQENHQMLSTRIGRVVERIGATVFRERNLRRQRADEARIVFEEIATGRDVRAHRQLQSDLAYLQTGVRPTRFKPLRPSGIR